MSKKRLFFVFCSDCFRAFGDPSISYDQCSDGAGRESGTESCKGRAGDPVTG